MIDIARQFFNFDRFIGTTPIGSGNINDTYRLDFEVAGESKSVLLQRLNHLVFKQPELVMANTIRICQYLETQPYPYQIATPIPAQDGMFLQKDKGGNYWRVFPFLDNTFAPEGISDPHIAYEAARAYGAFARALQGFPAKDLVETIPGFHDTDQRWEVFLNTIAEDPTGRVAETQAEIEAMFSAKPVFDRISQLKKSGELPLRVSHNDTKAGNVLFDLHSRKARAVIDLDTVMPGTILSDYGDMVRTFVPDGPEDSGTPPTLRSDMLDALTRGFLEETADFLNKTEIENLRLGAAWMAGEQALRFLTDWLAGDVYFKTTVPNHNLIRSRNQLALFGCMMYEL